MDEAVNMAKGIDRIVYKTKDIDRIRRNLQVGEILHHKVWVKDTSADGCLAMEIVPVKVVGIYPFLVEVEDVKGKRYTITYVDMLLEPHILKGKARRLKRRGKRYV